MAPGRVASRSTLDVRPDRVATAESSSKRRSMVSAGAVSSAAPYMAAVMAGTRPSGATVRT